MLAESHDLPRETVSALHALVGRAHNAVYRARRFQFAKWAGAVIHDLPRRLRGDRCLWLSALLFYGGLVFSALAVAARPELGERIASRTFLEQLEEMYNSKVEDRQGRDDALMTGFYIQHNASIGLQSYIWGAFTAGLGTVVVLESKAIVLGAAFGHMARSPHAHNFYQFVTAHGPFELTAIVFAGAAGLWLGRGWIRSGDLPRLVSLQRAAVDSLPLVGLSVLLFVFAAFLEGFVSASRLPYPVKAGIALVSASALLAYLFLGGRSRPRPIAETAP
jgi:uncharacterized membrane protein SpoIIM required for sporulation